MRRLLGIIVLCIALVLVGLYMMRIQVRSFTETDRYEDSVEGQEGDVLDKPSAAVPGPPPPQLAVEPIMPSPGNREEVDPASSATLPANAEGDCPDLVKSRKLDEARACYLARLEKDPQDAEAILDLGIIEALEGNSNEAFFRYQSYLQLVPEGMRAAQVRLVVSRYEAALAGKQPSTDGDTLQSNPVRRSVELFKKAYVFKERHPDRALRLAREALEAAPVSAERLREEIEALMEEIPDSLPKGGKEPPRH